MDNIKLKNALLSMDEICDYLYYENNLYWQTCSGLFHYGMYPRTLAESFSTWFLSKVLQEREFLSDLRSLINSTRGKELNAGLQLDILAELKHILKRATELIDELSNIQNIEDFVSENSFIGDKELYYCRKHNEEIKKIADIIIKDAARDFIKLKDNKEE